MQKIDIPVFQCILNISEYHIFKKGKFLPFSGHLQQFVDFPEDEQSTLSPSPGQREAQLRNICDVDPTIQTFTQQSLAHFSNTRTLSSKQRKLAAHEQPNHI